MKARLLVFLLCLLACTSVCAQETSPNWAAGSWRHANMNMPDPALVAGYAATGADAVIAWCTGRDGTFYPSQLAPLSSLTRERNVQLGEWVREVHRHKMRAVGYFAPLMCESLTATHPEWFERTESGVLYKHGPNTLACLNSGYRDWLVNLLVEIASKDHLDGFWADGWMPIQAVCYCDTCRRLYKRETGSDLPSMKAFNSLPFRRYLAWRDRHTEENVRYVQEQVRKRCPWVVFYGNYDGVRSHSSLPTFDRDTLAAVMDVPSLEVFYETPTDLLYPHLGLDFMRNGARGHPVEAFLWLSSHHFDRTAPPQAEVNNRLFTCLTEGVSVQPAVAPGGDMNVLRTLFHEITVRLPWIEGAQPVPYAAVLISENAVRNDGGNEPAKRVLEAQYGVYAALLEDHIPVTAVADEDLTPERLASYRVLVLPSVRCLSDAAIRAIRDYVRQGGSIVATGETGTRDEWGEPRPNGMGDLFGVADVRPEPESKEEEPYRLKLSASSSIAGSLFTSSVWKQDVVTSPALDETAGFDGPAFAARVVAPDAQTALTFFANRPEESRPALVLRSVGKGRVAWFGVEVGKGYYETRLRHLRGLLTHTVVWAGGTPPVQAQAPADVVVKAWRQPQAGGRWVVHLLNHAGSRGLSSEVFPWGHGERRPAQLLEMYPIRGITVSIRDADIRRVTLQPQGITLPIVRRGDTVTVKVPELIDHAMVVAERKAVSTAQK